MSGPGARAPHAVGLCALRGLVARPLLLALPLLLTLTGCDDGVSVAATAPASVAAVPPAVAAERLLHGSAEVCGTDLDCAPNPPTPVCALGGCLGILSADSRAAVEILVERAQAARPETRRQLQTELRRRLKPDSVDAPGSPLARAHALRALAALARVDEPAASSRSQDAALIRAYLEDRYPFVAAQARLGLARLGHADGLRVLLDDVRDGTEPLRVEALDALAALGSSEGVAADQRKKIEAALVAATAASSWAVRSAAGRALAKLPASAERDEALSVLAERDDGALSYALDKED